MWNKDLFCRSSAEREIGTTTTASALFLLLANLEKKVPKNFGIQEFWSTRAIPLTGLATFRSRQLRKQVEAWPRCELTDVTAKVFIYEAFVGGKLEAPKHFARTVHDLYFEPKCEDFRSRTIWSLSNAFTSAFKELDPIPQFRATAKLAESLDARSHSPSNCVATAKSKVKATKKQSLDPSVEEMGLCAKRNR